MIHRLPAAGFPLLGVLNQDQIAAAYGNKLVMLFLGGFILSKAMEKSMAFAILLALAVPFQAVLRH